MSKPRSARRSAAEWTDLVRAWEQSGLSQAAFAEREGVHVGTFGTWAWRLGAKRSKPAHVGKGPTPSVFVPVRVRVGKTQTGASVTTAVKSCILETVEVVLSNGRSIRCNLSQVGDSRLATLLAVAEGVRKC